MAVKTAALRREGARDAHFIIFGTGVKKQMGKSLFIAEKPSVAQEFAKVLKITGKRGDGYLESENAIVTWCVGHLVTMSYP